MASRSVVNADDHEGYRLSLRTLLTSDGRFDIIAESSGGFEAIDIVLARSPDLLLLDLLMEDLNGVEVLRTIRAQGSKTRVLVLTSLWDADEAIKVEEAGGNGFVLKRDRHSDVIVAIDSVLTSDDFIAPGFSDEALARCREYLRVLRETPDALKTLTLVEAQVLGLLAQGYTSREIGERLGKSSRTVDDQIGSISKKLGAESRRELIRYALRRGFPPQL